MLIYLDVCCLNRPFDDQTQERIHLESEAVLAILERCQRGTWQILGSEGIDSEVSRIPDQERYIKVQHLASIVYTRQAITRQIETRAGIVEQQGFKPFDSLHIACAEAGKADIFLSVDDRLVGKAKEHQRKLHVRVENPVLWFMEVLFLDSNENNSGTD